MPAREVLAGLGAARGPADESTFRRAFGLVSPDMLDRVLGAWMHTRASLAGGRLVIAIDGKAVRGAKNKQGKAPHLVAALARASGGHHHFVAVGLDSGECRGWCGGLSPELCRTGLLVFLSLPQRDGHELAGPGIVEEVVAAEPGLLADGGQLFPAEADEAAEALGFCPGGDHVSEHRYSWSEGKAWAGVGGVVSWSFACFTFPAASASRTRFPDHAFQDTGISEVAEEHDLALPDPEDLDGCRRERLSRRGQGPLRPHLHDHHLRVLGLVELCDLEVLQSQRRGHDVARILANRLPALQAGRRPRRREGRLDHRIGREQVNEAVDIPAQDQVAALGQDIGGCGGWHAAFPSLR
jgi:hypothetical protein